MMSEQKRAISPPLPPDPTLRKAASPSVKASRDSVISDTLPPLSTSASQVSGTTRSRAASDVRSRPSQALQPQPIQDAVSQAFDQSLDQSQSLSQLDPSFIAQVTEAVVKNLASVNLGVASQTSAQYSPSFAATTSDRAATQSPVFSDTSFPTATTPPSPHQDRTKDRDLYDHGSPPLFSDAYSEPGRHEYAAFVEDDHSDVESSEPTPLPLDHRRSSRYAATVDITDSIHTLHDSKNSVKSGTATSSPSVSADGDEGLTTLEKAWQLLFDKEDKPTSRFSQFVRGIAMHLINEYEPKSSLVISPAKLLRFFEATSVQDEAYPWRTILGGSTSCASIGTIFRRLGCQYHLIQQSTVQEQPNLPALTPHGFEFFMTCLVQAHPDDQYKRLSQAVRDMPISNADNSKERFPKKLSRRLLPAKPNAQIEQRLIASMVHDPNIRLRSSTSMPPPPPVSSQQGPLSERQRMPYTRAPHSNAFEDDDIFSAPSTSIERERMPYVAKEGTGKIFTDSEADRQPNQYRSDDPAPPRPHRQGSGSSAFAHSGSTPPEGSGRSRLNTGPGTQPPLSYNNQRSGRRTPPLSRSYSRGSGPVAGDSGNPHAHRMSTSNLDETRFNARRTAGSSTAGASVFDDDPRARPIPIRHPQQANGYDSNYGSNGMPHYVAPLATSLPRPRGSSNAGGSSYDDRRRSAYSAGPVGSGGQEDWRDFNDSPGYQIPQRHSQDYSHGAGPNGSRTR